MKILAFLQNQWFRDPASIARHYERRADESIEEWWRRRVRLNKAYLFYSCLTGKRLKAAFGEQRCQEIIWENVSPRMAGKASECFGVDQDHVDLVMAHFEPDIVLLFGKVANGCIAPAPFVLSGPHPAARGAGVVKALSAMAAELQLLIARGATV